MLLGILYALDEMMPGEALNGVFLFFTKSARPGVTFKRETLSMTPYIRLPGLVVDALVFLDADSSILSYSIPV